MQIKSCYNLGYMSAHFVQGDKPGAFLGYGVFSSYVDYVDIVDSFYGSDANEHNTLRTAITDNDDEDFTSVKSLTVEEMKVQSNFAGFDFDNVWAISPDVNDGYPYLKIQK